MTCSSHDLFSMFSIFPSFSIPSPSLVNSLLSMSAYSSLCLFFVLSRFAQSCKVSPFLPSSSPLLLSNLSLPLLTYLPIFFLVLINHIVLTIIAILLQIFFRRLFYPV
uniref:Uncharacterized protein n=1 Tax=Cacopsylla melanoneura TaxID=428564 RepID=A0A8D8QLD4_9HEMI